MKRLPRFSVGPSQKPKKAAPQHQVRTSTQDRTLESMFAVRNPGQGDHELVGRTAEAINESNVTLVSVLELRETALKGRHGGKSPDFLRRPRSVDIGLQV